MKNKAHLRNRVLFSVHLSVAGSIEAFLREKGVDCVAYISSFSPTAVIRVNEDVLEKIITDERCRSYGGYRDKRLENMSSEVLEQIGAYGIYTGEKSTRVGMISAEGEIFSLQSPQLAPFADSISVLPYPIPPIPALHPSVVLSSLIGARVEAEGKEYRGIAEGTPTLFSTSETSLDVLNAAERILEEGVDIINFSAGLLNPEGYSEFDLLLDRLIESSGLLLVTASGNRRVVSSPGIAYNTLTVGNLQTKANAAESLVPPWNSYCINSVNCSGYLADDTTSHKPDVMAPGSFIPYVTPSGGVYSENTGTSFACPWVTGIAVILRERFPSLTALELKALIALSCDRKVISAEFNPIIEGEQLIRLRTGCGLVSLERAIRFAQLGRVETIITDGENILSLELSGGETLYVAICFYLSRDRDDALTLELDGKIVCDRPRQNLHILEYTAERDETVRIRVTGTPNIECARILFTA